MWNSQEIDIIDHYEMKDRGVMLVVNEFDNIFSVGDVAILNEACYTEIVGIERFLVSEQLQRPQKPASILVKLK